MSTEIPGLCPPDADRAAAATSVYLVPRNGWEAHLAPHGVTKDWAKRAGFSGSPGDKLVTADAVFVGIGDGSDAFAVGAAAASLGEGDYVLAEPNDDPATYLAHLAWGLGSYQFTRYRQARPVATLIASEGIDCDRLFREVSAAYLVRDLVNTPTEDLGPDELEAAIRTQASAFGARLEVVTGDALEDGFPLICAVGRAAEPRSPRLIDLRWGDEDAPKITLVGKGVCFDTGGLNLKGGSGMSLMKKDMGGAANALGLAMMIMAAKLPVRLRLLVPAVENAIGGNAFRPGDIFRSRTGLSVEISNTDAEGRLILADALAYAAEEKPDRIISLATLTGAARVALGPDLPPIYSTDEKFAQKACAAGMAINDPLWPMPLWKRYAEFLSSSVADVNHAASTPFAGSITAALFLTKFVPDELSYTHIDLYAWVPSDLPGRPKGGEAMCIRALFDVLAEEVGAAAA